MNHSRQTWHGFTLIELLVVVAIMALLIGLLLPSLGRSRGMAQSSVCGSQIRQLVVANELYAHDHDERAMPGAKRVQTHNLDRWHGTRKTPGAAFTPEGAPILAYIGDEAAASAGVRACPTFEPTMKALATRGVGFERCNGGYGYNNSFLGTERYEIAPDVWEVKSDLVGSRLPRFRAPTQTVAFADSAFAGDELIEYSFIEPPYWPQYVGARPDPSVHFRHTGHAASTAWLDGHVTSETMSFTAFSGLYTADAGELGIGWFGDVDSNRLFDYE